MNRIALVLIAVFSLAAFAAAQGQNTTISGFVANGTTHKPAAGDQVTLIRLSQGMEEEAHTKTDARGGFKFTIADGGLPHLVRVHHDDVNYHEPVPPGTNSVQVTVYNSVAKVPGLQLLDESQVFEANDTLLKVVEVFRVRNSAFPPVTQPAFEFYLPEGAAPRLSQAVSGNGIPVKTPVLPAKEKNKYTFNFPLRPGITQLELVYTIPYTGKLSLQRKLAMSPQKFYVLTANGIDFSPPAGSGFQETQTWPADATMTGVSIHVADAGSAREMTFDLSGKGFLPQPQESASGQTQTGPAQQQEPARPGGGLGEPNKQPDPLHNGQWLFLGVLTIFLAAGAVYVYTLNHSPVAPIAAPAQAKDRGTMLLEAMKEEFFQLESDRLQGKISAPEYESAKAALDKTLQRAVQRQGAS